MDEYLEVLDMTVADVLQHTPATVKFFIDQHTACVGCQLAHFCTIEDVIKTYEFDENNFLETLSKYNIQQL